MALLHPHDDVEAQPLAITNDKHVGATYDSDAVARTITRKQLFYILGSHALGAGIIDAVANFALACAMYRTTHKEIRLWPLDKNTIAGDMGVTVIIQGILTMLITSSLVRKDIRAGRIEPFSFAWPRWQGQVDTSRWRSFMARAIHFLSPVQTLSFRVGLHEFSKSLFIILIRGFVISTLYFFLLWPLAIAITAPLYGGIDMHGTWTPEIIKAIFGGVLGIAMNPFIAMLVLGAEPQMSLPPSQPKISSTTCIAPAGMRQAEAVSVTQPPPAHTSSRT